MSAYFQHFLCLHLPNKLFHLGEVDTHCSGRLNGVGVSDIRVLELPQSLLACTMKLGKNRKAVYSRSILLALLVAAVTLL